MKVSANAYDAVPVFAEAPVSVTVNVSAVNPVLPSATDAMLDRGVSTQRPDANICRRGTWTLKQSVPYRILRSAYQRGFVPLALNPFLQYVAPGHFYSPVPDRRDIDARRLSLFHQERAALPGIDLCPAEQAAFASELAQYLPTPFPHDPDGRARYAFNNSFFGYADGTVLYAMLRHFHPRRIIEVGSGHSSAAMLDTVDRYLPERPHVTFIEPYPDRLLALLRDGDRTHLLLRQAVQDVPLDRFRALESGDLLFIDSSHVAKIGSDVLYLLTEVLPVLNTGVLVQIHDIFWPFEYPEEWVDEGRAWNEAYFLKAFLQFNNAFEVLWFNSYLRACHPALLQRVLPDLMRDHGGSIWLRKTS